MAALASSANRKAEDHLGVSFAEYTEIQNLADISYKILFLDVLFPMDLDKVIFVDAGKYPVDIDDLFELCLMSQTKLSV